MTDAKSVQLDMFTDYAALEKKRVAEKAARDRERKQQEVVLAIKDKWGKNAILRGMSFSGDDGEGQESTGRRA